MKINTSKINAIKVAAVIQGHGGVLAKTNTNTYGAEIPAPKLYEGPELKYIGLKYCGFALWSGLDMANQVVDVVKAYMGHHLHGTKIDIEALGSAINEAFAKPYFDFLQEVHDKRGAYADPANINTQHPILIPPPTDPDMFGINKKYNSSNAEKIFIGITEDEYRAGLRPAIFDVNGNRHFSTSQKIQPKGNKIVMDWGGHTSNGGLLPPGKYYFKVIVQQNGLIEQMLNGFLKF